MASLAGTDLGDIQRESSTKTSGLFHMPLPGGDSDEAVLIDLFGNERVITVEGRYVDTTANIQTFLTTMEGTHQSGTQTLKTYTGGLITKSVFVMEFTWNYEKADVGEISYTLVLLEGAAI